MRWLSRSRFARAHRSNASRSATACAVLETWRPYGHEQLGRRIRILWEGSEYRGRGRQTVWDGNATLSGNTFEACHPINLWNIDKTIRRVAPEQAGMASAHHRRLRRRRRDAGGRPRRQADPRHGAGAGRIERRRPRTRGPGTGHRGRHQAPDARLPAAGAQRNAYHEDSRATSSRNSAGEDALYVCITLEDGHLVWSSPIYLLR